jgi:hypothetical protein
MWDMVYEMRDLSRKDRPMERIIKEVLSIAPEVRYCALYLDGKLFSEEKKSLKGASSSESDKYEELIVNPTLLKLITQRGEIDCGGAQYVIIRYGNFYEFVKSLTGGHISVGIELTADPFQIIPAIEAVLMKHNFHGGVSEKPVASPVQGAYPFHAGKRQSSLIV